MGLLWVPWGASWDILGASRGPLGASWEPHGKASWSRLEASAHPATVPGLWLRGLFSVRGDLVVRFLGSSLGGSWGAVVGPLGVFWGLLGGLLGAFGGLLGASWGPLGASWDSLKAENLYFDFLFPLLGPLEAFSGPSWALLGASWAVFRASGAVLGTSWGPPGLAWGALEGLLRRLGASESKKGEKAKNIEKHNGNSTISASRSALGSLLGGLLGRLGGSLGCRGAILGVSGAT